MIDGYYNAKSALESNPTVENQKIFDDAYKALNDNLIHDSSMFIDFGRDRNIYYPNDNLVQ